MFEHVQLIDGNMNNDKEYVLAGGDRRGIVPWVILSW